MSLKRIGVSDLRKINAKALRELNEPLEICHKNTPLRVLVPFKQYMAFQELLSAAAATTEMARTSQETGHGKAQRGFGNKILEKLKNL